MYDVTTHYNIHVVCQWQMLLQCSGGAVQWGGGIANLCMDFQTNLEKFLSIRQGNLRLDLIHNLSPLGIVQLTT